MRGVRRGSEGQSSHLEGRVEGPPKFLSELSSDAEKVSLTSRDKDAHQGLVIGLSFLVEEETEWVGVGDGNKILKE